MLPFTESHCNSPPVLVYSEEFPEGLSPRCLRILRITASKSHSSFSVLGSCANFASTLYKRIWTHKPHICRSNTSRGNFFFASGGVQNCLKPIFPASGGGKGFGGRGVVLTFNAESKIPKIQIHYVHSEG